uniref:Uncharacterized protein n=1 Tax=Rhizophora mucronata TaxID=61149 RepID=A0A2P2N6H8_RHIMU
MTTQNAIQSFTIMIWYLCPSLFCHCLFHNSGEVH